MKIYNLFPRYFQNINSWQDDLPRIKGLGFDRILINPIHYTGSCGNMYAAKNFYGINPLFIDSLDHREPVEQLKDFLKEARAYGLKVLTDITINYTSKDNPLTMEHRSWYLSDKNGNLNSPGVWQHGKWIEQTELVQFDHLTNHDREGLWEYFKDLILYYLDLGFDGFRVNGAYQAPKELWAFLIKEAKKRYPESIFIGESLHCTPQELLTLAESKFDIIVNSAKYWDFEQEWFFEQYNTISPKSAMLSFPESHYTMRMATEFDNNVDKIKQEMAFTALISSYWMLFMGAEWGWREQANIYKFSLEQLETKNLNFEELIKKINLFRDEYPILNKEGLISALEHDQENEILILNKNTMMGRIVFVINKTENTQCLNYFDITKQKNIFSSHDLFDSKYLVGYELKVFIME
ncbi:MAG: alpha-amylase family glycosyl hydrolase [Brevinema sp.]